MRILQDLIECLQYNRGLAVLELMGDVECWGDLPPREQTSLVPNLRNCLNAAVNATARQFTAILTYTYCTHNSTAIFSGGLFWETLLTANANNDNGAGTLSITNNRAVRSNQARSTPTHPILGQLIPLRHDIDSGQRAPASLRSVFTSSGGPERRASIQYCLSA